MGEAVTFDSVAAFVAALRSEEGERAIADAVREVVRQEIAYANAAPSTLLDAEGAAALLGVMLAAENN